MSGTSRRWGSLSASVARAGDGLFLESATGTGSGSGLAGRELGWGVLGEGRVKLLHSCREALRWARDQPPGLPSRASCGPSSCLPAAPTVWSTRLIPGLCWGHCKGFNILLPWRLLPLPCHPHKGGCSDRHLQNRAEVGPTLSGAICAEGATGPWNLET